MFSVNLNENGNKSTNISILNVLVNPGTHNQQYNGNPYNYNSWTGGGYNPETFFEEKGIFIHNMIINKPYLHLRGMQFEGGAGVITFNSLGGNNVFGAIKETSQSGNLIKIGFGKLEKGIKKTLLNKTIKSRFLFPYSELYEYDVDLMFSAICGVVRIGLSDSKDAVSGHYIGYNTNANYTDVVFSYSGTLKVTLKKIESNGDIIEIMSKNKKIIETFNFGQNNKPGHFFGDISYEKLSEGLTNKHVVDLNFKIKKTNLFHFIEIEFIVDEISVTANDIWTNSAPSSKHYGVIEVGLGFAYPSGLCKVSF